MENAEASSTSLKERMQLINQLRRNCEQLLIRYGKVERVGALATSFQRLGKALGLRRAPPETSSRKFEAELEIEGKPEKITISSTSEDPAASKYIQVMGERHMNELFLSKDDALILENWGMGEDVDRKELTIESSSSGEHGTEEQEREYPNPRQATIEEIRPCESIVDAILRDYPIT